MPRLIRFALATAIAALAVAAPLPAQAAPEDCEGLYLAREGRTLFDVDQRYVPPPLRGFQWDCASRITGEVFDDGVGISSAYNLFFVDATPADYVDMIRSFENAGWIIGPINLVDTGDGQDGTQYDSAGLAELGDSVQWATSRFSNASTGRDIISITYADGIGFDNDVSLDTGSIIIELLLNDSFTSTGFVDPSVLSNLRSVFTLNLSPASTGVLCGSAVMLMLVVGWPGSLLSSVIGSRYEQLFGWTQKGVPAKVRAALRKTQPRWLVWVGFVAAAVVAGFVDPAFGFNYMSLRVLITGFLSFALFNVVGWALVKAVVNRIQPDAKPVVNFRWGSLIVVLVAVLVARLLEFSPGVIFGLVAGLTYAVALVSSRKAIVVIVGSAFALALGLVGWVAYSLIAPLASASFGNPVLVTITEFLAGVTIEGVSSLPLALLPFAALDGGTLITWKKWVWGLAYAIGLAAFMLVLLTIPDSFGGIAGDFGRWLALFGVYAVLAVGIWVIDGAVTKRKTRSRAATA
jgi:hypothetical protein